MKPIQKRLLVASILYGGVFILSNLLAHVFDPWNQDPFYIFPPFERGYEKEAFFIGVMFVVPLLFIPLGLVLSKGFIHIYLKMSKKTKKIQLIGFARIQTSSRVIKMRYLNQIIIGVLLCMNVWIVLFQTGAFSIWVLKSRNMTDPDTGRMYTFPMEPWWWLPLSIAALIISISYNILDSGLVHAKQIHQHPQFSDTEQVGKLFWNLIKGYAGISVIANFFLLIFTPYGQDAANATFPLYMGFGIFFYMVILELMSNWGRGLIFKTVKKHQVPEIIDLNYTKTPFTELDQLFKPAP